MAKAYSADMRQRVIGRVESGASRREAEQHYEVSPSTAVIWVKCFRETGQCAAKPRGGSTSPLERYADFLLALIEVEPDLTLDEVLCAMRKHKVPGSRTAVWRFFQRHKIAFKKKLARGGAGARGRSAGTPTLEARTRPIRSSAAGVHRWDFRQYANTQMVRLYGRCARGERLVDHVPQDHWKTITLVAALRRHRMAASDTIDGVMTGKRFLAYVKRRLAPTLKRNEIVMIDNLPAHKAAGVREAIEARGATLRYLPKYSPDLNPIEMAFSKLKAHLRKVGERRIPRLRRRIGSFARNLTAREAANYFRHAGYA